YDASHDRSGYPAQNIKDKLKETEDQLRETLRKVNEIEKYLEVYEKTFHETPYMMHAVNEKGEILMANKREHDMLGYQMGELRGKTIYDIYSKSVHHEATQGLKKVVETGTHQMTYTTLVKKDGSPLRCDIASSAIFGDNGKFISTVSVLRPIDSDELLRILNGIVDDKNGPLARYMIKE
ncbi:MAG: PAS domain S-box protein, partial [Bdellovibrionales bacterium]